MVVVLVNVVLHATPVVVWVVWTGDVEFVVVVACVLVGVDDAEVLVVACEVVAWELLLVVIACVCDCVVGWEVVEEDEELLVAK